MIFWEVPGAQLPTWQATEAMLATTEQASESTEAFDDPGYDGSGQSAWGYMEHTESGKTENADHTIVTGSSSYSFSSSYTFQWTFTETYRGFPGASVQDNTRSLTASESGITSGSSSFSFGNTTSVGEDGYTISTAGGGESGESSSSAGEQGETIEWDRSLWNSTAGAPGAYVTSGTATNDFGGPYEDEGETVVPFEPSESDTAYELEPAGGGLQTTHLTTAAVDGSTWDTYERTVSMLTTTAGGTASTTTTVEWRSTVETTLTVDDVPEVTTMEGAWPSNAATETRVKAARCHQLYEAGLHEGLAHWCDVWTPVAVGSLVPSYSAETITLEPYTYNYEVDGYSQGQSTEGGITTYERVYGEFTVAAGPTPSEGGMIIRSPAANGFQHYNSLAPDDPVFATFTIHLPTTVTDTAESTARKFGRRVMRGNITQVVTLNAEDSLSMGAAVSTFAGAVAAGGYGLMDGPNTITWQRGIYNFTYHEDGSSSSGRRTETTSLTEISPRGRVWHVQPQSVDEGGIWNDQPNTYMELPCSLPDL